MEKLLSGGIWLGSGGPGWDVGPGFSACEELHWTGYGWGDGGGAKAEEGKVGVSVGLVCLCQACLDCLDMAFNEAVGLGVCGGGCHMGEGPVIGKLAEVVGGELWPIV